jgi:hypothetical protein
MKIDWKHLCATPGYISLKKAVIKSVTSGRSFHNKQQHYKNFNWIINRAKHYAYHLNKPIEEILNEWEAKRNYSYENYYQPGRFPKLNKASNVKQPGVKHYTKFGMFKKDPVKRKARSLSIIMGIQKANSKRKDDKARWSKRRKDSAKRLKEIRKTGE